MSTKVVPVEPTDAMVNAMLHEITARFPHNWTAQSVYRAALAAAPPQPELSDHLAAPDSRERAAIARPKIVCLCGSTRFKDEFMDANYRETMAGKIVLSVGFYMHADNNKHGESIGATPEQKIALDELHKRKIDLCDEVLVLNVGNYIGESTRSEIDYALAHHKPVRYLETGVNLDANKPDAHLRSQIADAQARQAKGEGIPGGAELAHYKEPIDVIVDRFLSWPLPKDFAPDCGITFKPVNHPNIWPIGTNLFTADQARQMVEHILAGSVPSIYDQMAAGNHSIGVFKDGKLIAADEQVWVEPPAERRIAQRRVRRATRDDPVRRTIGYDRRQNAAGQKIVEAHPPCTGANEPVPAAPASTLPLSAEQQVNDARNALLFVHSQEDADSERRYINKLGDQALRAIELEQQVAEKDREIVRLTCYFDAWIHWRSLQTGDVQKMLDAAIRCEKAEAELAELRRVKS